MVGPGHGVDIYASSVLGLGGFGLSPAALELADALLQAPLASRAELRVFSGLAKSSVGRSLAELTSAGLLRVAEMGYFQRRQERYWLSELALAQCFLPSARLHSDGGIMYLVSRLGVVESLYEVVATEARLGSFKEFSWADQCSYDAAASFPEWVGCLLLEWCDSTGGCAQASA